jgi:hypothetical protein
MADRAETSNGKMTPSSSRFRPPCVLSRKKIKFSSLKFPRQFPG